MYSGCLKQAVALIQFSQWRHTEGHLCPVDMDMLDPAIAIYAVILLQSDKFDSKNVNLKKKTVA